MDLRIEMECKGCGWPFRRKLGQLYHGSYLSCPFCNSTDIRIKGDMLVDDERWSDGFEPLHEDKSIERKFRID